MLKCFWKFSLCLDWAATNVKRLSSLKIKHGYLQRPKRNKQSTRLVTAPTQSPTKYLKDREREGHRKRDRDRHRERNRQTDTETDTHIERGTGRQRYEKQRQRHGDNVEVSQYYHIITVPILSPRKIPRGAKVHTSPAVATDSAVPLM